MKKLYVCSLLLLLPFQVAAQDLSNLYDRATLSYWQTRYPSNIQWNFQNVILPILTPQERRPLAGVQLRFPLIGEIRGEPLEFYSYRDRLGRPNVTMPMLSIKFFDDLGIASAWLLENGYTPETVTDYVAMLKYIDPRWFPGGGYLPPLRALRIPANALDNQRVSDLSQKILKSAIIWILAHELGHIRYRHLAHGAGVTAQQAQEYEIEADRFATEIMRRIGVAPIGMGYFLVAAVHWWPNRSDCRTAQAWKRYVESATHPLTTRRLGALAQDLRARAEDFARKEQNYSRALAAVRNAARDIDGLARFLGDEDLQGTIRKKAELFASLPDPLAPRRPGQMPAPPTTPTVPQVRSSRQFCRY